MLLAIDTSTRWIGLALYEEYQVLGEFVWETHNFHTVELAPAIQQLLQRCKKNPKDIEVIGVALGPGSFTSLRIGLAAAKGMALGLRIPLVGIPSLDATAYAVPLDERPLLAILAAGRGRLAYARYEAKEERWQQASDIQVKTAEELASEIGEPTLVCGELGGQERQVISRKWKNAILCSPAKSMRRPTYLAEMAWKRWKADDVDDPAALAPIYLHLNGSREP